MGQNGLFTGMLRLRDRSLGMLAQLEARKGKGILSLGQEAEADPGLWQGGFLEVGTIKQIS